MRPIARIVSCTHIQACHEHTRAWHQRTQGVSYTRACHSHLGKGTRFMVMSLRSTLSGPSKRTEAVRLSSSVAAMAFIESNGLPPCRSHAEEDEAPEPPREAPAEPMEEPAAAAAAGAHAVDVSYRRMLAAKWALRSDGTACVRPSGSL
jgi:hypothetical protein